MAQKSWTLLDTAQGTYVESLSIEGGEAGKGAAGVRVTQRRLRGGLQEGVDEVRVDNGLFSFSVLPTRGMSIWKAWHGERTIGWKSPVSGPVHPQFVATAEPSGLGWLDGFDELLVRCGLESNGAPEFDPETGRVIYPLHGRIGNKPAHRVSVSIDGETGETVVAGQVDECRFHFLKLRLHTEVRTRPGELGFRVVDVIENLSASPAEAQMLYHVNFGVPLLDAGSRVLAPAKVVVPRNARAAEGIKSWDSYRGEEAAFAEQVYFLELLADPQGMTQTLLKNAHGTAGVSLHYKVRELPCFTVWKNTTAVADGYVTGLEPGTNYPNPRTFEGQQGRVAKLPGKGRQSLGVRLVFHPDAAAVTAAERAIAALQSQPPRIWDSPQPTYCAD